MPGEREPVGRCFSMARKSRTPTVEHRQVPPIRIEEPIEVTQARAFNGGRSLRAEVLREFAESARRNCSRVNLYS